SDRSASGGSGVGGRTKGGRAVVDGIGEDEYRPFGSGGRDRGIDQSDVGDGAQSTAQAPALQDAIAAYSVGTAAGESGAGGDAVERVGEAAESGDQLVWIFRDECARGGRRSAGAREKRGEPGGAGRPISAWIPSGAGVGADGGSDAGIGGTISG